MSDVLYSVLNIDGVEGKIYDEDAIHEESLPTVLQDLISNSDAFKTAIRNIFYPVGKIVIGPDPTPIVGGTWELRPDLMIIGAGNKYEVGDEGGSADAIVPAHRHTVTSSVTGGSHTHTVSGTAAAAGDHFHTPGANWNFSRYQGTRSNEVISEISGHGFTISQVVEGGTWGGTYNTSTAGSHMHSITGTALALGSDHTHSLHITVNSTGESVVDANLPPYRAYEIWERTA